MVDLPKTRIKRRSRYDVMFYFPDGASIRWISRADRTFTQDEMIEQLEGIIRILRGKAEPRDVRAIATGNADADA